MRWQGVRWCIYLEHGTQGSHLSVPGYYYYSSALRVLHKGYLHPFPTVHRVSTILLCAQDILDCREASLHQDDNQRRTWNTRRTPAIKAHRRKNAGEQSYHLGLVRDGSSSWRRRACRRWMRLCNSSCDMCRNSADHGHWPIYTSVVQALFSRKKKEALKWGKLQRASNEGLNPREKARTHLGSTRD